MNAITTKLEERTLPAIHTWLVRLHESTAGRSSPEEAIQRIDAVLDMLRLGRYPASAFTQRSLEHVASKCRFWPSYGELCEALDGYLLSQRPEPPRYIPAPAIPDWPDPSPTEIQAVADKLAAYDRERAQNAMAREAAMPTGHASRPLRDVTAKGDDLRRMREARGLRLPA